METILKRIDEKKSKLQSLQPLPQALQKNLDAWYKIALTYTSNAIEGNTLTHEETALVIEKGITIGGKTIQEHLEAINHAKAIDFVNEKLIHKKRTDLSIEDILDIHRVILQKIDTEHAGVFRKVMVRILGSTVIFPNYLKVPELMHSFITWLHETTEHPVKVAALAHLKLVNIHPFVDGNGRVSRLLMNLLLIQNGYPLALINREDRISYISAIESARTTNDMTDFFAIIFKAVETSLDNYLEAAEQSEH